MGLYSAEFAATPEMRRPLHAIDYLFAAALLKAYPKKPSSSLSTDYNFVLANYDSAEIITLAERLSYLKILTMDDLNLEAISV